MKKPGKEVDRSTNLLPHSQATTATKDDYDDSNFSNQSKYKKFTNFLKESKEAKQQNKKTKQLECNCWVCKILDSSVTTDDKTSTAQYEPYNIVSETGDSIFYDPLISSIFNNEEEEEDKSKREGQIYIAVDRILDFVQQDELLAKHINGVNLNKNEY